MRLASKAVRGALLVLLAAPSLAASGAGIGVGDLSLTVCLATNCDRDFPAFPWQGDSRNISVTFPSRATGATLHAKLFVPPEEASVPESHPGVVILPGSSGIARETHYRWAARDLAGHGYVALSVDPQGVGQSATFGDPACQGAVPPCPGVPYQQFSVWLDAAESGIDFLLSQENPYRELLDQGKIGAAGHSLGARAVSVLQETDPRVDAVVAWDNLASSSEGDQGSASGGPPIGSLLGAEVPADGHRVVPRKPAMGQASDGSGIQLSGAHPDIKKTAYNVWRAAGVPAMELAFRASDHGNWAQTGVGPNTGAEHDLALFAYYSRAWFDLWLLEDDSAFERLLAEDFRGTPRGGFLSEKWRSGFFLPEAGIDCPDFAACG